LADKGRAGLRRSATLLVLRFLHVLVMDMTLAELSLGCYMYARLSSNGYFATLDLTKIEDCKKLLTSLFNEWGCLQFVPGYRDQAAEELEDWFQQFGNTLPTTDLLSLTAVDLDIVEEAYNGLVGKFASKRKINDKEVDVTFGPVGTAKIFFALRPDTLMPWDTDIYKSFNFDGSASTYRRFLLKAQDWLIDLSKQCEEHGFKLTELPTKVGRAKSSLPKLMDEYLWVTVTNKWQLQEMIERWTKWS
jgi:hypothetical protein